MFACKYQRWLHTAECIYIIRKLVGGLNGITDVITTGSSKFTYYLAPQRIVTRTDIYVGTWGVRGPPLIGMWHVHTILCSYDFGGGGNRGNA